jgi:hypothetical protein
MHVLDAAGLIFLSNSTPESILHNPLQPTEIGLLLDSILLLQGTIFTLMKDVFRGFYLAKLKAAAG